MKSLHTILKQIAFLLFLLAFYTLSHAQTNYGEIRGKVLDEKTNNPLDFVTIKLMLGDRLISYTITDENGNYFFKGLNPGNYNALILYVGYINCLVKDIEVNPMAINYRVDKLKYAESDIVGCIFKRTTCFGTVPIELEPTSTSQIYNSNFLLKFR